MDENRLLSNKALNSLRTPSALFPLILFCLLTAATTVLAAEEHSHQPFKTVNESLKKISWVQDISGFVQNRHYFDVERDSKGEEFYELRNDWRLEVPLKINEFVSGLISSHLQLDYGLNKSDFHSEEQTYKLHEAYAEIDWKNLNARLGRQIIRWGKGDEINPVDNFTPENLKEFFNFERADRKLPVLALYPKVRLTERYDWEGVWIPFFNETFLAESDQDWKFFYPKDLENQGFLFLPETRPGRKLKNSIWATRLIRRGSFIDLSLSYAYHFEQMPTYEVTRDPLFPLGLAPSAGTVKTVWKREHTVGGDFEFVYKGWGFRGEAAFIRKQPHVTGDTLDIDLVQRKDTIRSILGFDYTYKSNNYINIQLAQTVILNHSDEMAPRAYELSVPFRLYKTFFHEKLKLQFSGIVELTDVDYYYKPEIIYEARENLEISAGMYIFEGELEGFWGQFDKNDQFFLSTKYYY